MSPGRVIILYQHPTRYSSIYGADVSSDTSMIDGYIVGARFMMSIGSKDQSVVKAVKTVWERDQRVILLSAAGMVLVLVISFFLIWKNTRDERVPFEETKAVSDSSSRALTDSISSWKVRERVYVAQQDAISRDNARLSNELSNVRYRYQRAQDSLRFMTYDQIIARTESVIRSRLRSSRVHDN